MIKTDIILLIGLILMTCIIICNVIINANFLYPKMKNCESEQGYQAIISGPSLTGKFNFDCVKTLEQKCKDLGGEPLGGGYNFQCVK